MRTFASIVSLVSLLSGCVALARLQTSSDGVHLIQNGHHPERVGPYWGPECVRIDAPTNTHYASSPAEPTMGKQPNLAHDPADQILRLVCVERIMSDADEPERNTWVMQHFRFDELAFDHLAASMMLVQCLLAEACLDAPHVPRVPQRQEAQPPNVWQYYEAGMMRWYAEKLDLASVGARLAELPLPPQARDVYLQLVEKARTGVIAFTSTLTPEGKQLFVDLPVGVFTRRAAEHARHGKLLGELALLTERVKTERGGAGVSDATVGRLAKLRVAYAQGCKTDCTRSPIFAAITKQLFWAHVSRGDGAAAKAESKLLDRLDPSAAQEIAEAQAHAIDDARARVARVASARAQGVDADAARATANGARLDLGDGRYVYRGHRDFTIHWESLVPDGKGIGQFEGKVAAVDRRGPVAMVRFQDLVSSWQEGTGCHETGRIDSIDRDGRINYRRQCTGSRTKSERRKVPPVTMPASEAVGLVPGDELAGFSTFGDNQERVGARVWTVKRGNRVVRLRDVAR